MTLNQTSFVALDLHDAALNSISADQESSACSLEFSDSTGKRSTVAMGGVVAFRAEDFGLQNVVSRLLRSSTKDFSDGELDAWVAWATSLSDAPSLLTIERKREWLNALQDGSLHLIVVEPSAGVQIAAIYATMNVQSHSLEKI